MNPISRRHWMGTAAAALLAGPLAVNEAHAELPKGTITLVVPFAAGGATDVVSRLVAQKLGERIQRTVVVDNVAGGGGARGGGAVRRLAPRPPRAPAPPGVAPGADYEDRATHGR
jgi:tripartite-type tricarboxylate transporter receptor subunit TctC